MRTKKFAAFLAPIAFFCGAPVCADDLRVLTSGIGTGTVTASNINCGTGGNDCSETYADTDNIQLTAAPDGDSTFVGWGGDCSGAALTCDVDMDQVRSVRATFGLMTAINPITSFTPEDLNIWLGANPGATTPARFISALPLEFRQNWLLMARSESLQTGTADSPRVLLPSASTLQVFTVDMTQHSAYPGAHPNAIEYMQWDATRKNFRFHEIVLAAIPAMGDDIDPGPGVAQRFPARARGVSIDDAKCFQCHSTRNVLNRGTTPGTDGLTPGSVGHKAKPNWDTYDSWGGMLVFNRDRIYQGSAEAAAFRNLFNPWTWIENTGVRSVIEQLELQPPGVPADHAITRDTGGGASDGHIRFGFDADPPPVTTEPAPVGDDTDITTAYEFNRVAGAGAATSVERGGPFVTLHQSTQVGSDEGRGVELFDRLTTGPNPVRIADELVNHRVATGNVGFDIRPIALAIAQRCISVDGGTVVTDTQTITASPPFASTAPLAFFDSRHGIANFNQLYDDTRQRAWSLTRRKADIEKILLDRTDDPYIYDDPDPMAPPADYNGIVQRWGASTSQSTDTSMARLRQEVFRRPSSGFQADQTVMGGIYVDRELISNTDPLSLYRYFLEPLGVSVDKWSMGVRGRSRTYTFADLFGSYTNTFAQELKNSLGISLALSSTDVCNTVMPMVDTLLGALPSAPAVPTYTDIQRIFNKSCIECHGGLGYPPYHNYGTYLDFSENENPTAPDRRMTRSYSVAMSMTSPPVGTDVSNSYLFQRITGGTAAPHLFDPLTTDEDCPFGIMPCGGPPLPAADIETIRRWILGGRPYTEGDPHMKTVDGIGYDFQSAGEFVLLRDEGMELQARQTPVTTAGPLGPNPHTGLSSCVSVNTAVAMRVGSNRVTYQPVARSRGDDVQAKPGALLLRVDGKVTELGAQEILLPSGGRIVRTSAQGGIRVNYPGGTVVVITPGFWDHHQIWYMNINVTNARAVDGVMGAIAPNSWLPSMPDGTQLGPRPASLAQRYQDLYQKFADAWRVSDDTSLFDYEAGLATASFTLDSWPQESPQPGACSAPPQPAGPFTNNPPTPMPQAEAERLCSAVADPLRKANCVMDTMATGERKFADTYLLTERLDSNTLPPPPVLSYPDDFAVDLPGKIDFTWGTTTDADGKPPTYRHCLWGADELFSLNKCTVVDTGPFAGKGLLWWLLMLLLAIVLLIVLAATILRTQRGLLVVIALVLLGSLVYAYIYMGRNAAPSATVAELQPGKVYFWKVVAEDDQGALSESQTRRLQVRQ